MTPLHGITCFYHVGFGARAVSPKTPIYFIRNQSDQLMSALASLMTSLYASNTFSLSTVVARLCCNRQFQILCKMNGNFLRNKLHWRQDTVACKEMEKEKRIRKGVNCQLYKLKQHALGERTTGSLTFVGVTQIRDNDKSVTKYQIWYYLSPQNYRI